MGDNLWSLIHQTLTTAGSIEQTVFYVLVVFSIACWAILLIKIEELFVVRRNNRRFLAIFESADSFGAVMTAGSALGRSTLLAVFKAALAALEGKRASPTHQTAADPRLIRLKPANTPQELLRLEMRRAAAGEVRRLQFGLGFWATTGATAAFIGLFGTVWGIMGTFRDSGSSKSASLAVVAPGISSALIATAAGLAVAIPAVMAYNWFLGRIEAMQDEADSFIEEVEILAAASGFLESAPAAPAAHPAGAPILHAPVIKIPDSAPVLAGGAKGPQA